MLHSSVCKKRVPLSTDKRNINLKTMEQLVACVVRLTAREREVLWDTAENKSNICLKHIMLETGLVSGRRLVLDK